MRKQWIAAYVKIAHLVCTTPQGLEKRCFAQVDCAYPVAIMLTRIRVIIAFVAERQFPQLRVRRNVERGQAIVLALQYREFRVVREVNLRNQIVVEPELIELRILRQVQGRDLIVLAGQPYELRISAQVNLCQFVAGTREVLECREVLNALHVLYPKPYRFNHCDIRNLIISDYPVPVLVENRADVVPECFIGECRAVYSHVSKTGRSYESHTHHRKNE